jgi:glycosyltransferase involved in cell wall biosynthesis
LATVASHGLPIVTTASAPPESPFVHRENMLLCPPKDPEALVAALETLIDDPALVQRLRAGALTLAREWFQWETAVQRLVASLAS